MQNNQGIQPGQKPIRVVCVTGGKGGVGKTFLSVNMAVSLSNRGHKVLLFDADLGLANVDVILGLSVEHNLSHVLKGQCELKDIIVHSPDIDILPAASGRREMTNLSVAENVGIIRAFSDLTGHYDTMIIDTAAGISESVMQFAKASQQVLVIVCNEPTSITDAYALIKSLHLEDKMVHFHIIANMVKDDKEGKQLFSKLGKVTEKFLDVQLNYLGCVVFDEHVRKAVRKRKTLFDVYPGCPAALNIQQLAANVDKWPPPKFATGNIEFFVEQLVGS